VTAFEPMRPLFALLARSLREDARSWVTYSVRFLLVALILFFTYQIGDSSQWVGAVGRRFFGMVLGINLFILCVVGLAYFASAITEEKEDDTLGLLRMTELNPLAILLGKSASRLIGALLLVAAQLPFALVAVTMGGLNVRQVLAGFVMLLSFAFMLANLGLLASTLCRRTSGASILAGLVLAVFSWVPAFLTWAFGTPCLLAWHSVTTLAWQREILGTGFSLSIAGWPCAVHLIFGAVCFLAAWMLFDRYAEVVPKPAAPVVTRGTAAAPVRRRASAEAVFWKDFRYTLGGRAGMALKGAIVMGMIVWMFNMTGGRMMGRFSFFGLGLSIVYPSYMALAFCAAFDAARIFKHERRHQTLSSLLGLPVSLSTLISQKVRVCLLSSIVPILSFGLGSCIVTFATITKIGGGLPSDARSVWIVMLPSAIASLLSLWVLVLQLSLRMRSGAFPVGGTIWILGNMVFGAMLIPNLKEGGLFFLGLIHTGAFISLARKIPPRLEELAAEE
jgi:ABC-type transport system involved in multi-copper enzyme maturation permease subunit